MTLKTQYVKDEDSTLVFIILLDDFNEEVIKVPFLVNKEDSEKLPQLENAIEDLPKFLKTVYNSGLAGEEISFEEEEVDL